MWKKRPFVEITRHIDTCLMAFFSRTPWISWHQKGSIIMDFNETRDDGIIWTIMQIICSWLQTDNHASTSSLNFSQAECSFWCPTNSIKALEITTGGIVCLCVCLFVFHGSVDFVLRVCCTEYSAMLDTWRSSNRSVTDQQTSKLVQESAAVKSSLPSRPRRQIF